MKVNIALLTVTDTRTFDNDKSGRILVDKINRITRYNNNITHKSYNGKYCVRYPPN